MKKFFLLMFAAALAMGANAQRLNSSPIQIKGAPQFKVKSMAEAHAQAPGKLNLPTTMTQPSSQKKEMQMMAPGAVAPAPKKAPTSAPYYRRPAGAFFGAKLLENGKYTGEFDAPCLFMKPYRDYSYESYMRTSSSTIRMWDVMLWGTNPETGEYQQLWYGTPAGVDCDEVTVMYGWEYDESPILYANSFDNYYRLQNNTSANSDPAYVLSCAYIEPMIGHQDLLLSSKSMPAGGRNGDQQYLFEHLTGAPAATGQSTGYWFGKNGSVTKTSSSYALNGIAQAFEKPTAPYLMKQVAMYVADLQVTGSVTMNCKIYKLNSIPAYQTSGRATLPDQPGEVIAYGRASLNANTNANTNGMIVFNLYDAQGHQIYPEIDDAILVAVEGFNDASMSRLANFSAYISADYNVDEGYGELAYMKFANKDSQGNVGQYEWRGLNNFFAIGEMMTGFSIYITIDNPFVCYDFYEVEDGEYIFPKEGGLMVKVYDATHVTRSIQFCSTNPSSDWTLSNANGGDMPDWLDIELIDSFESGSYTGNVNAVVYADPLPRGVRYREATVRFAIPGDYIFYTFIQEDDSPVVVVRGDANDNGVVTPADISTIINYLLGSTGLDPVNEANADCDQDGSITPSDIAELINYLLTGEWSN